MVKKFFSIGIGIFIFLGIFFCTGCSQYGYGMPPSKKTNKISFVQEDISDVEQGFTFQEIKYQQLALTGNMKLDRLIRELNRQFKADANKFKKTHAADIRGDYERTQNENCRWYYKQKLTLIRNDAKYFSILSELDVRHGLGAHGRHILSGYNFDVATGRQLNIYDFIKNKEYLESDLLYLLKPMQDDLFYDYHKKIKEYVFGNLDLCFIVNDHAVDVYFQQYDIACYAMGIIKLQLDPYVYKPNVFRK